ncbi:MAG: anthranilate phosphoribosyltransferase [Mailhella sp.]|nr:anthranilate phosphoribosyltransferase [Mailhella sp.]
MFLLIDNHDSFTYNLVQAFGSLGREPLVLRNDDPRLLELAESDSLRMVCISSGPGRPEGAGFCLEFLKRLNPRVPVLGVCLGHQILGRFAGADVVPGPEVMHGRMLDIMHDGRGLYRGIPNPMTVGLYHTHVVRIDEEHPCPGVAVSARGPQGEVMSLRFRDRPWVGIQYHPESILTPEGLKLLGNFPNALESTRGQAPTIGSILEVLARGLDLSEEQAELAFAALFDGSMTSAQVGSFLMGLRMKGESPGELAAAVRIILDRAVTVQGVPRNSIDIVGTGGDGKNAFNCSTAAALTLAGMGYRVIKHGNRAVSSTSGAADAIESLGLTLERDPQVIVDMLKQRNFAFQYAPYFHPAFEKVGSARMEMGIRTLFNMLGPMVNPACPDHLMLGVATPEMVDLVASALQKRPAHKVAVFCGAGGYDELTTLGRTRIVLLTDGKREELELDPAALGFSPCRADEVEVGSREEAAAVLRELLAGRGPRAMRDMLTLNAAFAIWLMEETMSLEDCVAKARKGVAEGAGMRVLS